MTEPVTRAFPGKPDQVASARAFIRSALGNCPALDDIVLLTSELCANATRHSASADGGTFEVTVHHRRESARIEVRDDGGSATSPQARDLGQPSEDGRGLGIVAALADHWGYHDDEHGRVVFFELTWTTSRARPAPDDPAQRQRPTGPLATDGDHQSQSITIDGTAPTTRPRPPAPRRETAPPVTAGAGAT
jgi:serine/threonine-protein kinase RsbW